MRTLWANETSWPPHMVGFLSMISQDVWQQSGCSIRRLGEQSAIIPFQNANGLIVEAATDADSTGLWSGVDSTNIGQAIRAAHQAKALGLPVVVVGDNHVLDSLRHLASHQLADTLIDVTDIDLTQPMANIRAQYQRTRKAAVESIKRSIPGRKDAPQVASVISATRRPEFIDRLVNNIASQNWPHIEVAIITQGFTKDQIKEALDKLHAANSGNIFRVTHMDDGELSLGARLNWGVENTVGDFVVKIDDDDFYFPNYISDAMLFFDIVPEAAVVGKKEILIYLEGSDCTITRYAGSRGRFTDFVAGATLVIRREVLHEVMFENLNRGEDSDFITRVKAAGHKIFTGSPSNLIVYRSKSQDNHTWKYEDDQFLKNCVMVGAGFRREAADE